MSFTHLGRLAVIVVMLAAFSGCAWEREELERERNLLTSGRNQIQDRLDQIPNGSRWAGHQDTGRMIDSRTTIDSRIGEIDRQLGR